MAYGYRYQLPSGLSEDQNRQLVSLAERTAKNASAVKTGKFRRGWTARISGDILTVQNSVKYAIYLELGTVNSRRHRYKVRDALNRIGFDTGTPVVTDPETAAALDRASRNQNPTTEDVISDPRSSGTGRPVEGINQISVDDLLLPSEDPVDVLITPVPFLADKIRPELMKINTLQESIEAYKKTYGGADLPTFEDVLADRRKLTNVKIPVIDLFNKAALVALLATYAATNKEEETDE